LIFTRDGVQGGLRELEAQFQIAEEELCLQQSKEVLAMLATQRKPFRDLTPEICEWKAQYEKHNYGKLSRFRVLVLDGPTKYGKTSWATSFFGEENTYVLNCQGVDAPALKDYMKTRAQWRAILYDEGNWSLVFRNKLLFQAGPKAVMLGQSPTGQYCYNVFVYMVPMIVCSNEFFKDCPAEAREYLEENISFVKVTQPCWVEDDDDVQEEDMGMYE